MTLSPAEAHREYLLTDYEANSQLIANYSSMRLVCLGGSLGILGVLLGSSRSDDPIASIGALALMGITASITVRVVATINRNLYLRCMHLAWIEKSLGQVGFYGCWDAYVQEDRTGMASHALVIATRALSASSYLYIGVCVQLAIIDTNMTSGLALTLSLAATVGLFAAHMFDRAHIASNFNDPVLICQLHHELESARRRVASGITPGDPPTQSVPQREIT